MVLFKFNGRAKICQTAKIKSLPIKLTMRHASIKKQDQVIFLNTWALGNGLVEKVDLVISNEVILCYRRMRVICMI